MGLRTRFPRADCEELRSILARIRRGAAEMESISEDWALDALDPRRALDRMPELWIRNGWSLRCAHRNTHDGIRCALWAEPADEAATAFAEALLEREHPFEAIDGEPGAWSYLCASILHRELNEWGASGAFRRWTKHEFPMEEVGLESLELPDDLRPLVVEDNTRVTVQFWTSRTAGEAIRVYEHRDLYRVAGFAHESSERLVGTTPLLDGESR